MIADYRTYILGKKKMSIKAEAHTIISGAGIVVGTLSAVVAAVHALPHPLTPDALVAGLATVAVSVVSHGLFSAATADKVTKFVNTVEPDVAAAVDAVPNLREATVTAGNKLATLETRVGAVEAKVAADVKAVTPDAQKVIDNLKAVLEGPAIAAVQTPPAAA